MTIALAPPDGAVPAEALDDAESVLPQWPLTLMIGAYPLWFVLGLSGFMWVVLALPMAGALLRHRRLVVPKGIGFWVIFLLAVAGSAFSIDTVGRLSGYVLRFGYYGAATVFLLYLLNGGRSVPVPRIVRSFTVLWMFTVAGGCLALVLGDVSFRSPTYHLIPSALLGNELINTLVTPGFADLQDIIGFPVPRPKAPFAYTNSWGSMMALSTPFAFMALADDRVGLPPRLVRAVLALSVVPIVVSLNRGLWLSLGIGIAYAAIRFGVAGRTKPLVRLVVAAVVVAAVLALSPLGDLVDSRLDNGHSDGDRTSLAIAALEGAAERPLFGWGAPRPGVGGLPSVGTHGQLWLVSFSHGFIGLIGFVGAIGSFFVRTGRQATTVGLWAHVVLLVAIVQMPVYLLIPHSLFAIMAAVAVAARSPR
ncbi:MAG: hypothetical protein OEV40_02530 [Acidimicrobiia bacterium]|nr:hypothetical protein [Acidimicrobiia bacterium]